MLRTTPSAVKNVFKHYLTSWIGAIIISVLHMKLKIRENNLTIGRLLTSSKTRLWHNVCLPPRSGLYYKLYKQPLHDIWANFLIITFYLRGKRERQADWDLPSAGSLTKCPHQLGQVHVEARSLEFVQVSHMSSRDTCISWAITCCLPKYTSARCWNQKQPRFEPSTPVWDADVPSGTLTT